VSESGVAITPSDAGAGCGGFRVEKPRLYPSGQTSGDVGRLGFSYQSSLCSGGCPLTLPVLENSLIMIAVSGDTVGGYTTDIQPASAGTFTTYEGCTCSDASGTMTTPAQPPATPCPSGQNKSCILWVDVQTEAASSVRLRVLDATGNVVDTVPFSVEQAQTIQSIVGINGKEVQPGADGAYAVHVADSIAIQSLVTSAGGQAMVYTEHGLIPSYSNSSVVASNPCSDGTDIEDSVAVAHGSASVTMTGAGARSSTAFDVVE
jgi:hypothetical protein